MGVYVVAVAGGAVKYLRSPTGTDFSKYALASPVICLSLHSFAPMPENAVDVIITRLLTRLTTSATDIACVLLSFA